MRTALTRGGAVLLAASLLVGCSAAASPTDPAAAPALASPSVKTPRPAAPSAAAPRAVSSPPVRVQISRIGVDAPLIDLGLAADGTMEVPEDFDEVGWFTGGGRPGGPGPVVIAGHVDSPTGPAVFIRLRELAPGDTVDVADSVGVVHQYVVTAVADYPKAAFPTSAVFGATAADELRLITCGGVFDASAGSYEDNRVVYAVRA